MGQSLSVVIITLNEEANIGRTLASVSELVKQTAGEIIVVDSGSTDRTVEIAKSFGAKVFIEPWKGYAAQKNFAIDKAKGDWILSLDADEEASVTACQVIVRILGPDADVYSNFSGVWLSRQNLFLGRWIKHGGFYPDKKLRLFRRGAGRFVNRAVHETVEVTGRTEKQLEMDFIMGEEISLVHHAYPTLQSYIGHMNKYSTLGAEMLVMGERTARAGPLEPDARAQQCSVAEPSKKAAEMAVAERKRAFSPWNIVVRPWATFIYNYFLRLGFLDGKEGLLLHLYHAVYVSWKYAKAWELSRSSHRETGRSAKNQD